jgi:ech hydrogenase subunit F
MPYFIMAGKTMKNLFTKPATRLYPVEKRHYHRACRGHVVFNVETCIFCGICQKKCPADAITVARKEKTWEIIRLKCISCGSCVDACPKDSLSMANTYSPPITRTDIDHAKESYAGAKKDGAMEPGQTEVS